MDLATSCKEKLAHFRVKELKHILTQAGLSKQGKKQDLSERILAVLADEQVSGICAKKNRVGKEEVAKLVDDIYRKMQVSGATDLAPKGQNVSDGCTNTNFKEVEDTYQMEKVRCPCGSSLQADSMIKCEDRRCNVWQHINCVVIPEKHMEGILPAPPPIFYCELCRLGRADPFWVPVVHLLYPVKLTIASIPTDGTSPVQSVEKTFQLTRADRDLLAKPEYDVQAWCMLLNDKVSFRMQWPQYANLQINGVPVRIINRPGSQLLGANGRDDSPIITPCTQDGINKISLTGCDARVFCLGVRIVKRRTVQQILNLIPKESDGARFEEAVARVCRCVGGGAATENADSDSDLEVVADSIPVNLRCPMSGSRMKIAGRFKPCAHMGCFDLEVFVEVNQRSRKWQCPICLKNYCLENVIIDPYFTRITAKMKNCSDVLTEIEVKPDGCWRVKVDNGQKSLGDLGQWHLPDGTLCVPMEVESKPKLEALKPVKQEAASEGHTGLKLGLKKNRNGIWEVSKSGKLHSLSSGNKLPEKFVNNGLNNTVPMSSSATACGRDGEDRIVNQITGGHFDYSTTNGGELDSVFTGQNPSTAGDAEVIVLSDSEEDTGNPMSSAPIYKNNITDAEKVGFSVFPHGISEPMSSSLGLFNSNDDDFGVPFWSLPSASQGGPIFQLFGSDVNNHTDAPTCPMSMNGYADTSDGLVDNPLAYGGNDPSLELFLPTRPSKPAEPVESRNQPGVSNGQHSDDWISLRLGGGGGGGLHCEPAAANELILNHQLPPRDGALDSLTDTASLLCSMSDSRPTKINKERSDGPFSFPRQKRSVRPRLYLSMESDSEEER